MTLRIMFRTDAAVEIGSGHVMRCLTLARALREKGAVCRFLMRDLPGHLASVVAAEGFGLQLLRPPGPGDRPDTDPAHDKWLAVGRDVDARECARVLATEPPDWLVIDHYALDARWQAAVVRPPTRLMVIDDLADRSHLADLLLDQNLGRQSDDYDALLPAHCIRLIGPRFALLRPEFAAARPAALARRGEALPLASILIAMGGVDKDDATGQVLTALSGLEPPLSARVTVVLGGRAPHLERVRAQAAALPCPATVLVDVPDMARLMTDADLAIGAAGSTSWERCCLGLPTLLLTLADNQLPGAAALDKAGAAVVLGDLRTPGWPGRLRAELARCLAEPTRLAAFAARGAGLVDGAGTGRVAAMLRAGRLTVRLATADDAEPVWNWRHAGGAARYYQSGRATPLADHLAWFGRALTDPTRLMLIVEHDGTPAGHVRFDCDPGNPSSGCISICLAEGLRGRGLALPVMEAAQSHAFAHGLSRITAQVHAANLASRRLFQAAGYRTVSQSGDFLCYELGSAPATPTGSLTRDVQDEDS